MTDIKDNYVENVKNNLTGRGYIRIYCENKEESIGILTEILKDKEKAELYTMAGYIPAAELLNAYYPPVPESKKFEDFDNQAYGHTVTFDLPPRRSNKSIYRTK